MFENRVQKGKYMCLHIFDICKSAMTFGSWHFAGCNAPMDKTGVKIFCCGMSFASPALTVFPRDRNFIHSNKVNKDFLR